MALLREHAPLDKRSIADRVMALLLDAHPEYRRAWGPLGLQATREDVEHHVAFLDAALALGEPEIMASYARWLAGVLDARGVPVEALRESFRAVREVALGELPAHEREAADRALAAALAATPSERPRVPVAPDIAAVLEALLAGRRGDVERFVLDATARGMSLADVTDEILLPALDEVGAAWERDDITPAEEHRATEMLRTAFAAAATRARRPRPTKRAVVIACVEGNEHAFASAALADAFAARGWEATNLGANVPVEALARLVQKEAPALLALSVSLPTQAPAARRAVDRVRELMGRNAPKVLVGGRAVRELPTLVDALDADGAGSDARAALVEAERLVPP